MVLYWPQRGRCVLKEMHYNIQMKNVKIFEVTPYKSNLQITFQESKT